MCSNSTDINALHSVDSTITVTVKYSPYMNWGRWNHNPNRINELIQALNSAKLNVQLEHDPTETPEQWVRITDSAGNDLAYHESVQHNRSYGQRKELLAQMAKEAIGKVLDSGSDTTEDDE